MRFGVLGCADIAWRRMLPAMGSDPDVTVVAVASRDPERAARFADRFGCEAVVGYVPLLERADIDAVYVPLPPGLHAEWIARALRAGKHVLAEKPLTTTLADATRLVGLARALGLVLAENFMFVRHSQHAAVRELLAAGAIGQLRAFTAGFAIPPRPDGDIRYDPTLGGGALLDIAGYPVRAAQLLLGGDLRVVGATLRGTTVDLGGAALLTTPDGVTAQLTFGLEHAYRGFYEVWGSAGRIVVDRAFTPPPDHPPSVRLDDREVTLPPDDQFAGVIAAFTRAVTVGIDSGLQGEAIIRQAALIDEIRDRAVRVVA